MLPSSRENLLSTDDSPLAKDELEVSEIHEQGFFQLSTSSNGFRFSKLGEPRVQLVRLVTPPIQNH